MHFCVDFLNSIKPEANNLSFYMFLRWGDADALGAVRQQELHLSAAPAAPGRSGEVGSSLGGQVADDLGGGEEAAGRSG